MRVLAFGDELERDGLPVPPYRGAIRGRAYARSDERVKVANEVGYFGYFAEDKLVIDGWALSDAFLARIPFESRGSFRVGHYARPIPPGYVESREKDQNLLTDPFQRELYDTVRAVVSGPLFSERRLRALWCFNVRCS
jgi:hypothetical protein